MLYYVSIKLCQSTLCFALAAVSEIDYIKNAKKNNTFIQNKVLGFRVFI